LWKILQRNFFTVRQPTIYERNLQTLEAAFKAGFKSSSKSSASSSPIDSRMVPCEIPAPASALAMPRQVNRQHIKPMIRQIPALQNPHTVVV
jgi:hypothetical protein